MCSARIVEAVPDLDAKYSAATQVLDEARHVETYARFLKERAGRAYPVNTHLQALLDNTLTDSRWDFCYLGMQVLIVGLALAAFGVLRDVTQHDLVRQLLAYVMADEARHVAFGRLALRDCYADLTTAEKREREDFVIEGCYLMRNRFSAEEVWDLMGYPHKESREAVERSPHIAVVPRFAVQPHRAVREGHRALVAAGAAGLADMGVLDLAGLDLDDLSAQDEQRADAEDRRRRDEQAFAADYGVRMAEADSAVAAGQE